MLPHWPTHLPAFPPSRGCPGFLSERPKLVHPLSSSTSTWSGLSEFLPLPDGLLRAPENWFLCSLAGPVHGSEFGCLVLGPHSVVCDIDRWVSRGWDADCEGNCAPQLFPANGAHSLNKPALICSPPSMGGGRERVGVGGRATMHVEFESSRWKSVLPFCMRALATELRSPALRQVLDPLARLSSLWSCSFAKEPAAQRS